MAEKYVKWQTFGTGALVGVVGSTISMLSNEVIRTPLGFSPMSFKNVVKVGIVSGLSTMGVMWEIMSTRIGRINHSTSKMATKSDYLTAFIFGILEGIERKLISSVSSQALGTSLGIHPTYNLETFLKVPISTGLLGVMILGATDGFDKYLIRKSPVS